MVWFFYSTGDSGRCWWLSCTIFTHNLGWCTIAGLGARSVRWSGNLTGGMLCCYVYSKGKGAMYSNKGQPWGLLDKHVQLGWSGTTMLLAALWSAYGSEDTVCYSLAELGADKCHGVRAGWCTL